ncbi:MAG: hypothetical protein IPL12_20705 [Bacteroidetes bacterium]|nr:hypothetical protein [Bacteroidota bacterium]MBK8345492.1 hypothetical protein [Bacteroidota bacterium]
MKALLLGILFSMSLGVFAQAPDCSEAKVGNFEIKQQGGSTQIKRTEKYQYETAGKIKITTRIEWTSDCSYKLIFVKANKAYYKATGAKKGDSSPDVLVDIIKKDGNVYYIQVHVEGMEQMDMKLIKLE